LGAAHQPAGFYLQIMSDSLVNSNNNGATGNGGWSNGTNVLFIPTPSATAGNWPFGI